MYAIRSYYEECVLLLTLDNGWVFYSKNHPRQSGIKNMDKIVVYAEKTAFGQKCFRMIYGEDYITRTYGQLFLEDSLTFSVLEGQAKMNENTTNRITSYNVCYTKLLRKLLRARKLKSAFCPAEKVNWSFLKRHRRRALLQNLSKRKERGCIT